jgi:hypothetical protein
MFYAGINCLIVNPLLLLTKHIRISKCLRSIRYNEIYKTVFLDLIESIRRQKYC